jgi:hypothetical protein
MGIETIWHTLGTSILPVLSESRDENVGNTLAVGEPIQEFKCRE